MMAMQEQVISGTELSVRVRHGGRELIDQIAPAWRLLCDESGDEEVFYRPEWAHAYLQAFEPKADVILITAWAGERLRGILPLVQHRIIVAGLPIVKLSLPANFHSARASLTICPGEEGEVALKTLWQATKSLPRWDMIDIVHVLEGSALDRFLALAQADGYRTARK